MNYQERTGLLSGFDPQNKHASLSFVLKTLMSAYARVNNRLINGAYRFFGTLEYNSAMSVPLTYNFLLPKGASNVTLWSMGYKLTTITNHGIANDYLALNVIPHKPISLEKDNQQFSLPCFSKDTTCDPNLFPECDLYQVIVDPPEKRLPNSLEAPLKRLEGNYYFFVVQYTISEVIHNSYLAFFAENTSNNDRSNQLRSIAEYVKYLSSGNPNYGESFTIFDANHETKSLSAMTRLQNRDISTPSITNEQRANDSCVVEWKLIDKIILPTVNKMQKRNRTGESTTTYSVCYASDLSNPCYCLFRYIVAIHSCQALHLPKLFPKDSDWCLIVRDTEPTRNQFAIKAYKRLITIFTHVAVSKRTLSRIAVADSNIGRLLFGTDGRWLLPIIDQEIRFKSPGNGSLLRVLCGKCSEASQINMICSRLASEVDGIYNDFLGKSTFELEDLMITDANIIRSRDEVGYSYRQLTDIDTTIAYLTNYSDLFRLLATLRSSGNDYFVPILQPQINMLGTRQGEESKTDSTKLMSIFTEARVQKTLVESNNCRDMIYRGDGGLFLSLSKHHFDDYNSPELDMSNPTYDKSILCPYSREAIELNEIFDMFATSNEKVANCSFFMPLTLQNAGMQISLSTSSQHIPLKVQFFKDGTMIPERAKPFKGNKELLSQLPHLRQEMVDYIFSTSFIDKIEEVSSNSEAIFARKLSRYLATISKTTNIFELLPYEITADEYLTDYAESKIPGVYVNFVTNCSPQYQNNRRSFLQLETIGKIMTMESKYSPQEIVNGFLLSSDWRKPSYLQHLALSASLLYARLQDKLILTTEPMLPFTTEIWPNFGLVPMQVADNGDLLIRTLNPCLSQRTYCLQMLLAAKRWNYVIGCIPREQNSINTQQENFLRPKIYQQGETTGFRRVNPGENTLPIVPMSFASVARMANENSCLDTIRRYMTHYSQRELQRKPICREIIMKSLRETNEWRSFLSLQSQRNEIDQLCIDDYYDLIHMQKKKSFVIDGFKYDSKTYREQMINSFIDSL
jgi:hypothetical protein